MTPTTDSKPLPPPNGQRKVLLHACCAPCSREVMRAMLASNVDYTVFSHNPNIHAQKEYEQRKNENIRFRGAVRHPLHRRRLRPRQLVRSHAARRTNPSAPCVARCDSTCASSAPRCAHEHGFPVITSSLGITRWKDMNQINGSGVRAAARYRGLTYWEYKWLKGGGSARMIEISKHENFYQQGPVQSMRPDAPAYRQL